MSNVVNKILTLAKQKGIKQSFLNQLIGGYRGKLTDWKNGKSSPSQQDIIKIAEYFNVSVDYLLNEDEIITTNKSSAQEELFKLVSDLSDDEVEDIKKYVEFVKSKREDNKQ
ncbi:MAG: helix-turn-helix transcriptional regulator [bacterium]|nr:helix-turn-helix transcriptional regulator [bacterium]